MSKFDEFMPLDIQRRWLEDVTYQDIRGERATDKRPELRNAENQSKYHQRLNKLLSKPYAEDVLAVLQQYITTCLPAVLQSEYESWQCTIYPSGSPEVISRVNISSYQHVFFVFEYDDEIVYTWYFKPTHTLEELLNRSEDEILETFYGVAYAPIEGIFNGIEGQYTLEVADRESALAILTEPNFVKNIREFNLELLQEKPHVLSKHVHSFDLADRLLLPILK